MMLVRSEKLTILRRKLADRRRRLAILRRKMVSRQRRIGDRHYLAVSRHRLSPILSKALDKDEACRKQLTDRGLGWSLRFAPAESGGKAL
jgi:hypothetical protein